MGLVEQIAEPPKRPGWRTVIALFLLQLAIWLLGFAACYPVGLSVVLRFTVRRREVCLVVASPTTRCRCPRPRA
jgi:hypothetical protein